MLRLGFVHAHKDLPSFRPEFLNFLGGMGDVTIAVRYVPSHFNHSTLCAFFPAENIDMPLTWKKSSCFALPLLREDDMVWACACSRRDGPSKPVSCILLFENRPADVFPVVLMANLVMLWRLKGEMLQTARHDHMRILQRGRTEGCPFITQILVLAGLVQGKLCRGQPRHPVYGMD